MLRSMFAALFSLIPASAEADIGWHTDRLTRGAFVALQSGNTIYQHILRKHTKDGAIFDLVEIGGGASIQLGRYAVTMEGNVLATYSKGGAVTRYAPHRCNRTLGTCRYTVTFPDGFRETRIRKTRKTEDGFAFQVFGLNGQIYEGDRTIDETGTVIDGWIRNPGKPKTFIKRVSPRTH